ncbi:MAG TPA: GerMN domain-containing protein [Actinomycetes bacterium]|nr:GerMN domain-containing protein [Actinomycetes bacterium]
MADRRWLRRVAALLVCLVLAACSAGVPPTGEVITIAQVASPTDERSSVDDPRGAKPQGGLKEIELVAQFMRVMATGDPAEAAAWVAPGSARRRLDGWQRRRSVMVYETRSATPSLKEAVASGDAGEVVVDVQVRLVGRLNGHEWTPLAGPTSLSFHLGRVLTEWRITSPPDQPWVDEESFKQRYRRTELFMASRDGRHVVPTPVLFDDRTGTAGRVASVQGRTTTALRMLLEGPRGRVANALDTAIPPGTRLLSVTYDSEQGIVTVNLSGQFTAAGNPGSGQLRMGQLVWTVNRLIPTAQVVVRVDGRPLGEVGADRFPADRLYRRTAPELAGLWPQRLANGDLVTFVRDGQVFTIPADQLGTEPRPLMLPANGTKSAPTWSPDGSRIAYLVGEMGEPHTLWTASQTGTSPSATDLHGVLSPPSWLPGSPPRLLALKREGASVQLWSVDADSGQATKLGLGPLPDQLEPILVRVSPDGCFVLAVLARSGAGRRDPVEPGGDLYLGVLGAQGVTEWIPHPLAPGLGAASSPVWVDPVTVAFVGDGENRFDRKKLWVVKVDGWGPAPVLSPDRGSNLGVDIDGELTVDPAGEVFVFKSPSELGTSLWMVNRDGRGLKALTPPDATYFDGDPNFASR